MTQQLQAVEPAEVRQFMTPPVEELPACRQCVRAAGRGQPGRLRTGPGQLVEQPVERPAGGWPAGEALAAIQRAVEVYRAAGPGHPAAYEPDLAKSLNNLSVRLALLGDPRRRQESGGKADTLRLT